MSNQASAMIKTGSTFPPVPQQGASALPLPLGRSSTASRVARLYILEAVLLQAGWVLKKSGVVMTGNTSRTPAQTVALRQVYKGLTSDLLGRSVEEDKSTLREIKPSCRMA